MSMTNNKFIDRLFILFGICFLVAISFQYPFSTNVPIGGDAPYHTQSANSISKLMSSPYPLSSLLFSLTRIIPVSWLLRFTIFMAVGYAVSGILLAAILRKLAGNLAAIFGLIFWSVSVWDVLPFYRDGTMAQLWSIPFLLLLFLATINRQKKLFIFYLICVYFAHPATFAIVALTLTLVTPYFWLRKKTANVYLVCGTTVLISIATISVFFAFAKYFPFARINEFSRYLALKDFFETRVGILFFTAPIGFIIYYSSEKLNDFAKYLFLTFGVLSFLSSFNSLIGVGAWERRFVPYFIISLIIFGAIGLSNILKNTFRIKLIQNIVVVLLFFTLGTHVWFSAQGYYKIFSGERSSLHNDELASYQWIDANLPLNALIAQTTTRGRGVEWLPVFANRETYIPDYDPHGLKLFDSCNKILTDLKKLKPSTPFALFHTWTEQAPTAYLQHPELFPLIYRNPEVEIYRLPNVNQNNFSALNSCLP